jgi:hypothetical protein
MLEDLLQRRPYNAVTDLIDAPLERGLAGKTAFIDADRTLSYACKALICYRIPRI